MATLATPGIAIRRGRMVHLARVLNSTWLKFSEVMPIFMTRLSDDSGDSMTGGCATAGSWAATRDKRSCTICRAVITSLAGSRISTTDDNPEHGLRSDSVEARDAVERSLQRHRDQRLHVVGGKAWRLGLDLDQWRCKLREHVKRRRA